MKNKLNLEIKDYGPINNANIELNKINIIGGVNGSGKSSVSRILYSFLKANTPGIERYVLEEIIGGINEIINLAENPDPMGEHGLPHKYTIDDDISEVLEEYEISKNKLLNSNVNFIIDEFMITDIIDKIDLVKCLFDDNDEDGYAGIVNLILRREISPFKGKIKLYNDSFLCNVTKKWFGADYYNNYNVESSGNFEKLTNVLYLDSVSLYDFISLFSYPEGNLRLSYEHNEDILNYLNLDSTEDNDNFFIVEKINQFIKGNFEFKFLAPFFVSDLNDVSLLKDDVSSGYKQIGLIQLLLRNGSLKNNSYLIIDEPEVNLHPEWQFKLAEILVLLAKELNINIYINSHSPAFIESIDAFTEYYDMEDDVCYYLTEESEIKGKYNFTKIDSNELSKLYDNLGNIYFLIDQIRLQKRLGE